MYCFYMFGAARTLKAARTQMKVVSFTFSFGSTHKNEATFKNETISQNLSMQPHLSLLSRIHALKKTNMIKVAV